MMDSEVRKLIHEEIKRQINIVLYGAAGENNEQVETIDAMYPGMPGQFDRPVVSPFGFSSRAIKGTISLTARIGDHSGNRVVMGHRDANRPIDLLEGESAIYSKASASAFMQVKMAQNRIRAGKTSDNTEAGMAGQTNWAISSEDDGDTYTLTHKTGATFQCQKNGSVFLSSSDSNYIFFNSLTGEISIASASGSFVSFGPNGMTMADKTGKQIISMDGNNKLQILADSDVIVSAGRVTIQGGSIYLGTNASFSAVMGEQLEAYLDSHTHLSAAPGNPTGPPIILSSVYNLNPTLSFKSLYTKIRSNII